ncbi:MAG: protein phosphatase [Desulfobacterales bacterium]|nr:protein phosphatase [Desulfobacterales bacterium]
MHRGDHQSGPLPPVPFPRAYWVAPCKLLAGEYPGAMDPAEARRKLRRLLDSGIRRVINLMEPHERDFQGRLFAPYEEEFIRLARERRVTATCVRRPIPDMSAPSPSVMTAILDAIDDAMAKHTPVYVHCLAGLGRTGSVVGCHLMRRGLAEKETVLQKITHLRRRMPNAQDPSPEIPAQRDMVVNWSEE